MNYLVTSFIGIAGRVSDNRALCDEDTTIADLLSHDFDDLDFELTKFCFEATHRIQLTEAEPDDYLHLTIAQFIERFVEPVEQTEPLFVTDRFLLFRDALIRAVADTAE
jgi:hypothetical protein